MEQELKKKKSKKFMIIGAVAGLIAISGVLAFASGKHYENTDNAQLDGDIIPIRSSVTAFVKDIRFEDNMTVKKGDTLLKFDSDELSAKVAQAEAMLDNAKANLLSVQNKATASLENASASAETAKSSVQSSIAQKIKLEKAQKDYDRVTELLKIKAATQEQSDNAFSNLEIAKSEYAKAVNQQASSTSSSMGVRAQAQSEQNQIELAKALIKQREAELTLARKQLSYAFVIAPCNGVVTKRSVQEGQYVSTGQSLCVVIDNENYWVSANFKETQLNHIKIGDVVEVKLDAFPDLQLSGKVQSYSGATGAKFSLLPPDNASGNFIKITQRFPVRISIENFPKDKNADLFPGLSAYVKVATE